MQKNAVLLHNIRSSHNVGSIFRTADAAGISHVYLSGYSPAPLDRFGRMQKAIAKTALGAQTFVPWTHVSSPTKLITRLKGEGFVVVGVEQDARSEDYRSFTCASPVLYVFGNEVRGLSKNLREQCDVLLEIPMHGKKESLNVAVAAGIVLFACVGVSR